MKLFLFLRSLIWTSILSVSLAAASLIAAFITQSQTLPLAFGLASIAMAVLSVLKR